MFNYKFAVDIFNNKNDPSKQVSGLSNNLSTSITNIFNLLLFIAGVSAVAILIFAGIKYVISQGDPAAVKGAKDTMLYAILGLAVVILAYAIVNYVIKSF